MQVASCGAWQIVGQPVFAESVAEAVAECSVVMGSTARCRDEPGITIESPSAAFNRLRAGEGLAALLLGPESTGLTADDMALCHTIVRIPSEPEFPSLNVAQAAAVLLYEWRAGKVQATEGRKLEPAPAVGRQEAVIALWSRLIAESGEWPASRLRRVEARARAQGRSHLVLRVNRHNPTAIAAYRKYGFVIARELQEDIGGGFVMDDYVMIKPL
jgi:tRNA C32,U32 (ribose-2'-O)-methylase TrmJ